MMDEEMEEPLKGDSLVFEIDLDYEFDASKYFDFCREESYAEAWEAQLWFESAGSYPPSPFVARLNIEKDVLVENVNTFLEFNDGASSDHLRALSNIGSVPEFSAFDENSEVQSGKNEDVLREDKKFCKGPFLRGSTLMKPTASQLAKQNRLRDVKRNQFVHRLPKPSVQKCESIIEELSEKGGHASKRQKLEGGHLRKVAIVKDQMDFLHNAPRKKSVPVDFNPQCPRLRITIPREPELETARRAERQRVQRLRSSGKESQEENKAARSIFKARPLNRKILEAPSLPLPQKSTPRLPEFQPFHLKTEERALQHSATHSSSLVAENSFSVSTAQEVAPSLRKAQCQASGPSLLKKEVQRWEGCDIKQPKFNAQLLNKKEFKFSTSRRYKQDPPTELFNKLSLNTDETRTLATQPKLPRPSRGANKDMKENIDCSIQQQQQAHEDIHEKMQELRGHDQAD